MAIKTLIINPKHRYALSAPPLGVGYLLSYTKKNTDNFITLFDENFLENPNKGLLDFIKKENIGYVGISFPSSAILRVIEICKLIRQNFGNRVVLFAGGYHPSSEPELTLRHIPYLDFVIIGDGEKSVSKINSEWKSLENVAYLKKGTYVQNKVSFIKNIDEIPHPNRINFDKRYFDPTYGVISGIYGRVATIMTSRGCVNQCNFCSSKLIQKSVRFHSIDYVMNEIDHICAVVGDFDFLYFLDVMFNASKKRVHDICNAMIDKKYYKKFRWAATVTSNMLDDELVRHMKRAGCFYLSFGFESGSDHALELMNKNARSVHNRNAMELCKKYSILANSAFLFGIPGEKIEDLEKSIDFVSKYNVFSTGVNIMKPLPGSPYYYQLVKKGIIKPNINNWYEISSINVQGKIFNDNITNEEYHQYIKKFNRVVFWKSQINNIRYNLPMHIKYFLKGTK